MAETSRKTTDNSEQKENPKLRLSNFNLDLLTTNANIGGMGSIPIEDYLAGKNYDISVYREGYKTLKERIRKLSNFDKHSGIPNIESKEDFEEKECLENLLTLMEERNVYSDLLDESALYQAYKEMRDNPEKVNEDDPMIQLGMALYLSHYKSSPLHEAGEQVVGLIEKEIRSSTGEGPASERAVFQKEG